MVLTLSLMPVRTAIPNLFVTAHRTGLSTRSIVGDQAALAEIVRRPTMRSRFCSWFCSFSSCTYIRRTMLSCHEKGVAKQVVKAARVGAPDGLQHSGQATVRRDVHATIDHVRELLVALINVVACNVPELLREAGIVPGCKDARDLLAIVAVGFEARVEFFSLHVAGLPAHNLDMIAVGDQLEGLPRPRHAVRFEGCARHERHNREDRAVESRSHGVRMFVR